MIIVDGNNYFRMKMYSDDFTTVLDLVTKCKRELKPDIVVFDGFNCNKRRRDIYPDYKMGRKPLEDNDAAVLNLIKNELAEFLPWTTLVADGWEADDVIATLCGIGDTHVIYSTDKDLLSIPNAKNPLADKKGEFMENAGGREMVRLYKTLVGDGSDNIKGLKGFGPSAWRCMARCDKIALMTSFERGYLLEMSNSNIAAKLQDNWATIKACWDIVGFFDVPLDEIQTISGCNEDGYSPKLIAELLDAMGVLNGNFG